MGLCKCPKKKVTNQFCFEHRVNVCEHCIVSDHTKCVVQSYLQWLNDSEYDPKCALCKESLETQHCTRLVCYDVFHSSCLEAWGSSHPPHTAPAGFKCPVCKSTVFPAPQLASPVALALKHTLSTWAWARKAMGLPAGGGGGGGVGGGGDWSSNNGAASHSSAVSESSNITTDSTSDVTSIPTHTFTKNKDHQTSYKSNNLGSGSLLSSSAAAISANGGSGVANVTQISPLYRKGSSSDSHSVNVMDESDTDDNKYKRRPAITWFRRWWRSYQPLGSGGSRGSGRRRMVVLLCLILLGTVLLLLARARSMAGDSMDPMLDPLNNPNIHVQDGV